MRRSLVLRSVGLALLSILALSMANRPPILASQAPAVVASAAVGGGFGGAPEGPLARGHVVYLAARPMSLEATKISMKLHDKLAMRFPNDTPLADVIKYIREATKTKDTFPEGIPFYVDPVGLQEADKTMASTILIDLEGIPLATTLRLVLKQLGLSYQIQKEGFILITSESSEDAPPEPEGLILDNLSDLRAEVKALRDEVRMLRGGGTMHAGPIETPAPAKPAGAAGGGFR